jgi:hypothetical protein
VVNLAARFIIGASFQVRHLPIAEPSIAIPSILAIAEPSNRGGQGFWGMRGDGALYKSNMGCRLILRLNVPSLNGPPYLRENILEAGPLGGERNHDNVTSSAIQIITLGRLRPIYQF